MSDPTSDKRLSSLALHPRLFEDTVVEEGNGYNVHLLCTAWVALLKDSPVDGLKTAYQGRRFMGLLRKGFTDIVRSYSVLGDDLLRTLNTSAHGSCQRESLHRRFAKTPIFREYHYFWKYGDPEALRYILSFLWFAKKADYYSEAFIKRAVKSWRDREISLGSIDFGAKRTLPLRAIVKRLLPPPDDVLVFKHGPGAVAEQGVRTLVEKNEWLRYHPLFEPIFLRAQGSIYLKYALPARLLACVYPEYRCADDIARLLMVRKNYKTARSVAMEPTPFMYVQQGVFSMLSRAMKAGAIRRYVDINDQGKNRTMCLEASADQELATLDSEAASDSISWGVVKEIFSDAWLVYLNYSRTDSVRMPDNSTIRVKKFAPMGSAVNFPVQCTFFCAVACLAYSLCVQGLTFDDFTRGAPVKPVLPPRKWLRVYGDDVIVHESIVDMTIALLGYYGLTVNVGKSFRGGSSVRESCGVYACDGEDVTPLLFKVKDLATFEKGLSAQDLRITYSLIDMANRAHALGYSNLRGVLIQWIHPASFVFMDASIPYSTSPWVVHGSEANHSSRKQETDRFQRVCVSIKRLVTKRDPVYVVRDDGHGLIIPYSAPVRDAFAADNEYWYSIALAAGLRKDMRISFAPLKDLERRSYLRRSLTPVA